MKLGYDLYEVVSDDIISLLNSFKKDHLIVFQLTKIDDNTYRFYLPIYQRFLARKYNMQIIKSIGILYYLVVLFCKKINIIGVVLKEDDSIKKVNKVEIGEDTTEETTNTLTAGQINELKDHFSDKYEIEKNKIFINDK